MPRSDPAASELRNKDNAEELLVMALVHNDDMRRPVVFPSTSSKVFDDGTPASAAYPLHHFIHPTYEGAGNATK